MKIESLLDHILLQGEHFGRSVVATSDSAVLFLYSFNPGQSMSEHTHSFSNEFLTVVEGEAMITVGTESVLAEAGQVVLVPIESVHSIQNLTDQRLLVTSFMSPKP